MPAALRRGAEHAAPLLLFAGIAVGWTWPLVARLGDALAGGGGDNYSFVWNVWWMRRVLATPGLPYFHTTYLFYPFGTSIADHPHTALPALVAATALKPLSDISALNLLILTHVFLNMACMYALAWTIAKHRLASVLAAVVFGLSPYLAVHMLGHFDLIAAWPLPLLALALHRATHHAESRTRSLHCRRHPRRHRVHHLLLRRLRILLRRRLSARLVGAIRGDARRQPAHETRPAAGAPVCGWRVRVRDGRDRDCRERRRSFSIASFDVSMHRPQNTLTAMWICAAAWLIATLRPRMRLTPAGNAPPRWPAAISIGMRVAAAFVFLASPLLWEAAQLVARGDYVTQVYNWQNVPLGVDLLSPFFGHPLHPLIGRLSARAYAALGENMIESVGWFGVVPVALLLASFTRGGETRALAADTRLWRIIALVFYVWALGPFLIVGGFDTGLKLPAILLRYVPFVANARMPGRAIVVVFMAAALLLAMHVGAARGLLRSAALQWLAVALVGFEYWAAPLMLTSLDWPQVYRTLAASPPGAVCEVPLGIGDGLSTGVGSQERRVLFYATQHGHPLVGGYIGRMPRDAEERIRRLRVAGALLALSNGEPAAPPAVGDAAAAPCPYLVVDRRAVSAPMASYLALLAPVRIASDDRRDLLRIR